MRVYVEQVNAPVLARVVWSWLRGSQQAVDHFLEVQGVYAVSRGARWLASWLRRCGLGVSVQELVFDFLDDVRLSDGRRGLEELYYTAVAEIVQWLERDPSYRAAVVRGARHPAHEPALRAYLSKRAFHAVQINSSLGVHSVLVVSWDSRRHRLDGHQPAVLYVRTSWLFSWLVGYGSRWGVEVRPLPAARSLWGLAVRTVTQVARRAYYGLLRAIRSGQVELPGNPPLRIAAEMFFSGVGRDPLYNSEFFWYRESSLPAGSVFSYFAHPTYQPTPIRQDHLRQAGIGWVDHMAMRRWQGVPLSESGSPVGATIQQMAQRSVREFWIEYGRWFRFFKATGARIHVSTYDLFAQSEALHAAMADLGGVSVSIQRSIERQPYRLRQTATDVHLAFAKAQAQLEQESGSSVRHFVTVGYLFDDVFDAARAHARQLVTALRARGVTFIVCFLDEGEGVLPKLYGGRRQIQGDYQFLFDRMAEDPTLGIILKPKRLDTLPQRLGPVWQRRQTFMASGQCLVLGGGSFDENYLPCVAACAADVTVNLLGGSTAGLESALAGTKTLLVRHGAELRSFASLRDRVVFDTWEEIWKAVEHLRAHPEDPLIGNWEPLLDELASLRDGHAVTRINRYITWLHNALASGQSRDEAMAEATRRYAQMWGADLITEIRQPPTERHDGVTPDDETATRQDAVTWSLA